MGHTFSVDAEPADRTDPGRCADRFSPNASPLFDAAREVIAKSPESFPIRQTVEVVVTSAAPLRQRVGYGPAEPMIEILVDAGVLWDERLVNAETYRVDPDSSGYSIALEPLSS
jgi:hypothetical protein